MTLLVPSRESVGVQTPAASDVSPRPRLMARLSAEALGTLIVVVAGLGVPLFTIPQSNPLPAALAAGLALAAAMLAVGYVSGGHFNPAVTVGNAIAGRIRLADAAAYVGAQLVGAVLGAVALFGVLRTIPTIKDSQGAFATVAAGFGEHSVIQVPMAGVLLVEVLGTALIVAVFLATTASRNPARAGAPFAVGLTTAMLLQLGQALGNVPFNPARATASAMFSGPDALGQLWLFWVAPVVGAAIAGLVFRGFAETTVRPEQATDQAGAALTDADLDDADLDDSDLDDAGSAEAELADGDAVHDVDDAVPTGSVAHVREGGAGHKGNGKAAATVSAPAGRAEDDEARSFFDHKGGK